jgi:hypothetical protein
MLTASSTGEKRKKKLQYLQQLIKDGPDDQHESEPSPERYDSYERSVSAEYDSTKPGSSPYILRSTIESGAISSNCASGSEALLAASTATFNDHVYATTQAYTSLEPNWNAAVYPPPPPPNMTWNVHPWTPSVEYFPSGMPAPEAYNYSSEVVPQSFAPVHTPSQLPRQFLSSADFYDLGSPSYGPQSQSANRPNVSRPASSSYYPARHYQPY